VKRLLEPFSHPSLQHSNHDDKILSVFKQLSTLPRDLYVLLEAEPEALNQCPVDETSPDDIRISYADALTVRMDRVHSQDRESNSSPMPEIRLEPEVEETPGISLTTFDSGLPEGSMTSTTLLASRKSMFGNAHQRHCSALLRLLYLHNCLHPGNPSSYTASLLVPLYSAMIQEVEVDDLAHVEADTFWLLEAMVAEFSALEDDGGKLWMKKISERLSWADYDLFTELVLYTASSIQCHTDPLLRNLEDWILRYPITLSEFINFMENYLTNRRALNSRWLAPVLSHTLPLPSLFLVWDALFSRQPQERGSSPKLEYLVDICASMLIRSKNRLHRSVHIPLQDSMSLMDLLSRMNTSGQTNRSLWTGEPDFGPQSEHSQDTFAAALAFFQVYDLKYVGGIDRVLQTAAELNQRREQEAVVAQQPTLTLGARFNLWRSYAAPPTANNEKVDIEKPLPKEPTEVDESTISFPNSLASQITTTVWRGITNQSAMDSEPPSPAPSSTEDLPATASVHRDSVPTINSPTQATSNIWGYAEKLKGSDAVATISKVSSNWRARGILGSWSATNSPTPTNTPLPHAGDNFSTRTTSPPLVESPRLFSPPIRSPRPEEMSPELSPQASGGLVGKTKSLFAARSPPTSASTPKSAPRPLLLNSAGPVVSGSRKSSGHSSGHPRTMSTPDTDEWADVMKLKKQHFHRDSQSSISSLSPSDAFGRAPKSNKSDWESDTTSSRIVSLNRRSVSPMAPNFRVGHARPSSRASSASSDIHSPPILVKSPLAEGVSVNTPLLLPMADKDSQPQPPLLPSSMAAESEPSDDSETTSNGQGAPSGKSSWKAALESTDTSRPFPVVPTRSARVRSKRNYPRPANLQIQDSPRSRVSTEQKTPSPSNLRVEWPAEDQDNVMTPKASSFDSDEPVSMPYGMVRSPIRSRKVSSGDPDRARKASADGIHEERSRKISSSRRTRKVSTESREVSKHHRQSAADDGDDEGYDELLSAYESEDVPNSSHRK